MRALGACIIASAAGPTPDSLAVLLLVLQAAFAINVVDSSLELLSRLAAQVRSLMPYVTDAKLSRTRGQHALPFRTCPCTIMILWSTYAPWQ